VVQTRLAAGLPEARRPVLMRLLEASGGGIGDEMHYKVETQTKAGDWLRHARNTSFSPIPSSNRTP
jgi:hypothetical protein